MTRTEVEDFTRSARIAAAASEYFSAFEPAYHNQLIRLWNIEVLAVHFFLRELNIFPNTVCNRMSGINHPYPFLLIGLTPLQIAGGTHKLFKYFRKMP
ncbi:hypothetical protein D3C80_1294020 [compost metagenome]